MQKKTRLKPDGHKKEAGVLLVLQPERTPAFPYTRRTNRHPLPVRTGRFVGPHYRALHGRLLQAVCADHSPSGIELCLGKRSSRTRDVHEIVGVVVCYYHFTLQRHVSAFCFGSPVTTGCMKAYLTPHDRPYCLSPLPIHSPETS